MNALRSKAAFGPALFLSATVDGQQQTGLLPTNIDGEWNVADFGTDPKPNLPESN
jgi:hypothetical protein